MVPTGNEAFDLARRLQIQYWRFNRAEFDDLSAKVKTGATWAQRLRLLHLCCAAMIESPEGAQALSGDDFGDDDATHVLVGRVARLAGLLLGTDSPYRPRTAMIWQGELDANTQRPPDAQGPFLNPSLTHLGCVEVLRLKNESVPHKIDFVPLYNIKGLYMATPALFRAGRLMQEDGRDEIVWLPALYGLSWRSHQSFDTDGSMTRFLLNVHEPNSGRNLGIGVGQQDWEVAGEQGAILVGVNSVSMLDLPIDVREPGWEIVAQGRGLDPAEIRKQVGLG